MIPEPEGRDKRRMMTTFSNLAWFLSCLPSTIAFRRGAGHLEHCQWNYLNRLLKKNRNTGYGRLYGFGGIRSAREYQERVPVTSYEDYSGIIGDIAGGTANLLTDEPVRNLVPTSGSSMATKRIPYTDGLKEEFQAAIDSWLADTYLHEKGLLAAKIYWSITPPARVERPFEGGVSEGFEEDSEYLRPFQRILFRSVSAVPPEIGRIADMQTSMYVTLFFLLKCRSLGMISVWNPTFLDLLTGQLAEWGERLCRDIGCGTLNPPEPGNGGALEIIRGNIRPDPKRAAEIGEALREGKGRGAWHARIWPGLRLISCWMDGESAYYASVLAGLFPGVRMQAKGLLATEGVVSFPLSGFDGGVLAYRSHFYEFIPEDGGPVKLAHELEKGKTYTVILTTGGGLYRYKLMDLVKVVDSYKQCPLVRFMGRGNMVSDLFGEKLNGQFVKDALQSAMEAANFRPGFVMVAPDRRASPVSYVLYAEVAGATRESILLLGENLEAEFRKNVHYDHCRNLGQLGRLRVFQVSGGAQGGYIAEMIRRGSQAGGVKPALLERVGGWTTVFKGEFIGAGTGCAKGEW